MWIKCSQQLQVLPVIAYLELIFEVRGVALGVYSDHVVVGGFELAGWNDSFSTQASLQDGVVYKDVLLLRNRR